MIGELERAVQHAGRFHVVDKRTPADGELAALIFNAGRSYAARKLYRDVVAFRERFDRVEDFDVAGAAAEMGSEEACSLVPLESVAFHIDERFRAHDDPRGAGAALEGAASSESARVAIELFRGQAFEGLDVFAFHRGQGLRAARDGTPVHEHEAASALTRRRTAVFRRCHAELLAERG